MTSDTGYIFDVQSFSLHDGPGCRTTVFMSGCFLRCAWCANPESWEAQGDLMFVGQKCRQQNGCRACVDACKRCGVTHTATDGLRFARDICRQCTDRFCLNVCPGEAIKASSRQVSVSELMHILRRDRDFWGPGGGVTFSGGEPFFQGGFLVQLAQHCKQEHIHTAIETTAFCNHEEFLRTMQFIDFAFIDVKHMDSVCHRQQTGVGNTKILDNISNLIQSNWPGRVILRVPVIRGFNDGLENAAELADFMTVLGLTELNLLPFHRLGTSKWEQLGKKYAFSDQQAIESEELTSLQEIFLRRGITCYIGSDTPF